MSASEHPVLDDIGERHGFKKNLDVPPEFLPEIMGQAACATLQTAL